MKAFVVKKIFLQNLLLEIIHFLEKVKAYLMTSPFRYTTGGRAQSADPFWPERYPSPLVLRPLATFPFSSFWSKATTKQHTVLPCTTSWCWHLPSARQFWFADLCPSGSPSWPDQAQSGVVGEKFGVCGACARICHKIIGEDHYDEERVGEECGFRCCPNHYEEHKCGDDPTDYI